jgi:uroporphyrinogen-III synthase
MNKNHYLSVKLNLALLISLIPIMFSILLTRPREEAEKDKKIFERFGFKIEILPLIDFKPLDFEVPPLENIDYVYFGSKRGVEFFLRKVDLSKFKKLPKFIVVGNKTAKVLEKYGFVPDIVLKGYSKNLLDLVEKGVLKKGRILIPTAKKHTKDIYLLKDYGFDLKIIPVYETVYLRYPLSEVLDKLSKVKIVIFTSPSTFFSLLENLQKDTNRLKEKIIVAIGRTTAKAVEEEGLKVDFIPSRPDMAVLAEELAEALNGIEGENFKK